LYAYDCDGCREDIHILIGDTDVLRLFLEIRTVKQGNSYRTVNVWYEESWQLHARTFCDLATGRCACGRKWGWEKVRRLEHERWILALTPPQIRSPRTQHLQISSDNTKQRSDGCNNSKAGHHEDGLKSKVCGRGRTRKRRSSRTSR